MLALTSNPVPGVKNTIPRGEFLLKKFAGNRFGAEKASGTASQLISRWPVADGGPAMLLGFPKKFLKAFTVFRILFALAPDASNTWGAAEAATGFKTSVKLKLAIASKSQCLARGANVRVVPRRLVIELVTDCFVCIGFSCLRFAFCFGFSGVSVVCAGSSGKAERPPETRHDCGVFSKPARAVLYQCPKLC